MARRSGFWWPRKSTSGCAGRQRTGRPSMPGRVEREKQLKSENLSLRARVRELESQLWGRKSEQAKGGRAGSSSPKASGRPRGQQKGKQGHGRTTLDGLAAQEEVVDLEEAQKSCPKCGLALEALGLDGRRRGGRNRSAGPPAGDPAAQVQSGLPLRGAARHCHGARPARLDFKGKLGISVWVEILLEKFDHWQPTHRLLQQWRDHGLTLSAGTVAGGLKKTAGSVFAGGRGDRPAAAHPGELASRRDRLAGVCGGGRQKRTALAFVGVFVGLHSRVPAPTQSLVCSASISLRQRQGTLLTDRYSAYKKLVRVSEGVFAMPFAGLTCAATFGDWAYPTPPGRTGP